MSEKERQQLASLRTNSFDELQLPVKKHLLNKSLFARVLAECTASGEREREKRKAVHDDTQCDVYFCGSRSTDLLASAYYVSLRCPTSQVRCYKSSLLSPLRTFMY